jgi:Saxitoxin biosynthesis operon protein SxtJ
MTWADIPRNPAPRVLRQFAGLWLLFFLTAAAWQGYGHGRVVLGVLLAAAALAVGPLGLVRPRAVRGVYVGSMMVTFPISWVVSRVVLALLFFGLFTPLALFFRLRGRDTLGLRRRPDGETYWMEKRVASDPRGYFRQC